MTKKDYFHYAINWAFRKGFSKIKANHEDYPDTKYFTRQDDETILIPDISARQFDKKHFLEIAMKTDQVQERVSKWKLLSTLAKRRGGKLFLMAPKGHKAFVNRILDRFAVDAKVIPMNV